MGSNPTWSCKTNWRSSGASCGSTTCKLNRAAMCHCTNTAYGFTMADARGILATLRRGSSARSRSQAIRNAIERLDSLGLAARSATSLCLRSTNEQTTRNMYNKRRRQDQPPPLRHNISSAASLETNGAATHGKRAKADCNMHKYPTGRPPHKAAKARSGH